MRLENKIAIVTGGGSGFGQGIVSKFHTEGARVVVADINEEAGQAVAESLGDKGLFIKADVSRDADMKNLIEATIKHFGRLDIMVNNAGMGHLPQPLEGISEDLFDKLFEVNIKSVFLSARYCVPYFKNNKNGVFLNIASTGGVSPRPNLTWYNMTKGAMITATRGMAVELAPFGIRVNALNPVAGDTPLLKTFMGQDTPEIRAKFLSTIPLGRFSTPQDMGNAACFLCSDEADMITGLAMEVDGGRCI
jgi:3-oxoacyl-[acyl-carrier protein] reductase